MSSTSWSASYGSNPNPNPIPNPDPHQVIFLVLTIGFGVSFAVLLPNAMSEPWYRVMGTNPLWGPFWGVFGSFDVSGPMELEKAVAADGGLLVEQLEPTTTLVPILLWIYQLEPEPQPEPEPEPEP